MENVIDILRHSAIFRKLTDEQLKKIAEMLGKPIPPVRFSIVRVIRPASFTSWSRVKSLSTCNAIWGRIFLPGRSSSMLLQRANLWVGLPSSSLTFSR